METEYKTIETMSMEKKSLDQPPLDELAQVLNKGLKDNFEHVSVEVVDCPDLTKLPFTLAKPGLCGKTKLVEVGGVPYLLPMAQLDKVYDLKQVAPLVDSSNTFIIGSGAGPHPYSGVNCEGIYNMSIENGKVDQQSRISKVDPNDESKVIQEILPEWETRVSFVANIFLSDGKPGKVLKVHAKKRTGSEDFVSRIRTSLSNHYKNDTVALGGAFLVKEGKANHHVMGDFFKTPITTDEQLNKWKKYYNMSAPLIALGTIINRDPELDLRVQHFHSFSHHGEAGHYHGDTTPDTIEYLGYFNTAAEIYRLDRPIETHTFGRD